MKCPVCSNKIQGDDQRLCERCGWEFDRYVTELSNSERELYDRKLGLARQTWKELLQARKDAERLKKEVARLKKELEQVWQEANEADTRAKELSGQERALRARIKELEKELRFQRKKAQKDAGKINRLVDESRRLQSSLTELEDVLEQERANARQARNEAQKLENTLKDRENVLQHQRNRAEDAERTARNLRASRDELQETASRLEQALSQERQNLQGARQEADNLRQSVAELQRSRNILGYVLAAAVIFIAINFLFFPGNKTSSRTAATSGWTPTVSTDSQDHAKHSRAVLKVETSPAGASVFVHGRELGISPVTLRDLSPGKVNLEVRLAGYRPESRSITLRAGSTSNIKIFLTRTGSKGRLYVNTEPSDARVRILNIRPRYHDGIELEAGRYHIEVSKRGYKTHKEWVRLKEGQDLRIQVGLEPEAQKTIAADRMPAGKTWTDPVTGMEFVFVKGGCYKMGCGSWTSDCDSDEKPVHTVCVDDFYIGKYEVTQGQWKKIMHSNPSKFKKGDNYPVENVSWDDAQEFFKKLNAMSGTKGKFRLPTEAEWEYACRSGGREEKYCGGDDLDRLAWWDENSGGHTHPVGTKEPNGLGIYDMSGNVWEWCSDWYDRNYYKESPRENPEGPGFGDLRVLRGASWRDGSFGPWHFRGGDRFGNYPKTRYYDCGLRSARTK